MGTLFAVDPVNSKNISEYSAFPEEQEVILMPGTCVRSKSKPLNYRNHLLIVHIQEVTIEQNTQRLAYKNVSPKFMLIKQL